MKTFKLVSVSKGAFAFCRYSAAVLVWLALILQIKSLLVLVFIIFVVSALVKVKRAPLVWLYSQTIERIIHSKEEILNERAMQFAHIMGSVLSFICIFLLYFVSDQAGWVAVFILAILKSISALGFCPASKLYECATNDSCCAFAKKYVR